MPVTDQSYADIARQLADALIDYARSRGTDEKKAVGHLQHRLCQLRREEFFALPLQEGTDENPPHRTAE